LGPEKVKLFFPTDNTHTSRDGASLNAANVVKGIKQLKKCKLRKFIKG
jgi:hypothetical protein